MFQYFKDCNWLHTLFQCGKTKIMDVWTSEYFFKNLDDKYLSDLEAELDSDSDLYYMYSWMD